MSLPVALDAGVAPAGHGLCRCAPLSSQRGLWGFDQLRSATGAGGCSGFSTACTKSFMPRLPCSLMGAAVPPELSVANPWLILFWGLYPIWVLCSIDKLCSAVPTTGPASSREDRRRPLNAVSAYSPNRSRSGADAQHVCGLIEGPAVARKRYGPARIR
jgi:hypothetical protein